MANEFLNPVAILQESLLRWENNIVLAKQVNREFEDRFGVKNEKIGYTVNARMPNRFRGRRGDLAIPEGVKESLVPITINQMWGQDLEIGDQDLVLTIDRFGERYIESAVGIICNMIDGDGFDLAYRDVYNFTGTPGTVPTDLDTYATARAILANHAVPDNGKARALMVDPYMEVKALGFHNNLFNPVREISRQYDEGTMGTALGFKWSMAQNVPRHTLGISAASTPLMAGANQTGNSLLTKGWANNTQVLNKGDIITIAGVNGVNPVSYRDNGQLRTFVVTADVTSDGATLATVPVSPDINIDPTSVFQTVTALNADSAVIKIFGVAAANFANISGISSAQGLAFHKDFMTLALVKLETPGGLDWSEQITDPKRGVAIRLTRGFDIKSNDRITRLDVLGGWKVLRPDFCTRVVSG